MLIKRVFDLSLSVLGLILLAPFFILIAILIKLESKGPVFFRQERVGQYEKIFLIHKFRTMVIDAEAKGLLVTVGDDKRITRIGSFLRKYKLDELPQLIDVFLGYMSLVGPRPEVPYYVAYYTDDIRKVIFSVRPGITDWASIKFRAENEILGKAVDPQRAYIEQIMPIKQDFYVKYVSQRSFFGDLKIIFCTLFTIFR